LERSTIFLCCLTLLVFQPPLNSSYAAGNLQVFPKSSEPKFLDVVDVRRLGFDARLMLATLQGIVNRGEPRIYLIYGYPDLFWLEKVVAEKGVSYEVMDNYTDLLSKYKSYIEGVIVYDPNLPDTANVATTLSGLENAVVVSPNLLSLVSGLGLRIVKDLRGMWKDGAEAYEWAFRELYPKCNKGFLAVLDPEPEHLNVHLRDYIVAHRIFTFFLYPDEELLKKILAETPRNIPVIGYPPQEVSSVKLYSEYGKFLVGSNYSGNLTVHSGMKIDKSSLKQKIKLENPVLEDKVYITFVYSDGDNMQYAMNFMLEYLWLDDARGSIPIGWTIPPLMLDLAPDILEYYYKTATDNDYFVGPPSGIGYIYPDYYNITLLGDLLNLTRPYFELLHLRTIWLLGASKTEALTLYAEKLSLATIFLDYSRYGSPKPQIVNGVPVFKCYAWANTPDEMVKILNSVAHDIAYRPLFIFVGVDVWSITPSELLYVVENLSEDFVVVRADVFAGLAKRYLSIVQLEDILAELRDLKETIAELKLTHRSDIQELREEIENLNASISRLNKTLAELQNLLTTLKDEDLKIRSAVNQMYILNYTLITVIIALLIYISIKKFKH
jgi:hypothetical protein